jgi:hypothetical protein
VLLATAMLLPGCRQVTSFEEPPAGEPLERVRLTNAQLFVEVSGPLGRIIGFGRKGGANRLWVNPEPAADGYANPGGDRLWPTLQPLWPRVYGGRHWPPDPILDGRPWTLVRCGDRQVVMQSQVQPKLGLRARRTLTLHPDRLEVRNTLTRVAPSVFPVCVWTNTQLPLPESVALQVTQQLAPAEPYVNLMADPIDYGADVLAKPTGRIVWNVAASPRGKIGTLGSVISATYPDATLVQQVDYQPAGAYADGSNLQVYRHRHYIEMETLSELRHLAVGESLRHTVVWTLHPVAAD